MGLKDSISSLLKTQLPPSTPPTHTQETGESRVYTNLTNFWCGTLLQKPPSQMYTLLDHIEPFLSYARTHTQNTSTVCRDYHHGNNVRQSNRETD